MHDKIAISEEITLLRAGAAYHLHPFQAVKKLAAHTFIHRSTLCCRLFDWVPCATRALEHRHEMTRFQPHSQMKNSVMAVPLTVPMG